MYMYTHVYECTCMYSAYACHSKALCHKIMVDFSSIVNPSHSLTDFLHSLKYPKNTSFSHCMNYRKYLVGMHRIMVLQLLNWHNSDNALRMHVHVIFIIWFSVRVSLMYMLSSTSYI